MPPVYRWLGEQPPTVVLEYPMVLRKRGPDNVAMGNMLSYNRTAKIQSGEYSSNPDITSTVVRNGLMLSQPANWNGQKLSVEYSLVDTRYTGGTKLYIDNTQEIGITVGTNKNAFSARSFLRGGLTYLRGKDTKGFTANIGYWF